MADKELKREFPMTVKTVALSWNNRKNKIFIS